MLAARRDQGGLALGERHRRALAFDVHFAVDRRNKMEAIRKVKHQRFASRGAIEHELVAIDQSLDTSFTRGLWNLWFHRAAGVVGHFERLGDMQRAGFAILVHAVPVEQPKRGVARLLDLGDDDA